MQDAERVVTLIDAPGLVPEAVLWDMDGTIIDTEPYWLAAEAELVAEFGGQWSPAQGLELVGSNLVDSAVVLQEHGVALTRDEIAQVLTSRVAALLSAHVPWRPGAAELLGELRRHGVPCALVTMSYREMVTHLLDALPAGTFDVVITGDEVSRGKPDPEPYLRAAEQLGVDIARCVAIEDSRPGVASALASGAATIAVKGHVPVVQHPGLSRVRSLETLDLGLLGHVLAGGIVDDLGDEE
ncbi:HAD family hydrolase [Sanguibacter sp. A247]|uniref:HAD family hydrolase n=1 Tax=unclassified Sanguibacter TaxID=2645534 RepID=UPI003FD8DAA4